MSPSQISEKIQISNFMFHRQILDKKYSDLKLHISPHRFWKINIQISNFMFPSPTTDFGKIFKSQTACFPPQILNKKLFKSQTSCFPPQILEKYSNFKLHVSPTYFGQKNIQISNFIFPPTGFGKNNIQISNFMFPPTHFEKKSSQVLNFQENPSNGSPIFSGGQTDSQSNEGLGSSAKEHRE